jgi:DnaJ-class molecular chaperone
VDTEPAVDYYTLLGISANADRDEMRRAWRQLVLKWHPDRAGPGATARFQTLSAAYDVLSDPVARAAYDRRRRASSPPRPTVGPESAPGASQAAPRRRAPGVMLRRLTGPLDALIACGVARVVEDGRVELRLNEKEAEQGGMVTISMRVAVHCAICAGRDVALCSRCAGRRTVEEIFSAWLAVPPGVVDGAVLAPSAQLRGVVRPVSFVVRRA